MKIFETVKKNPASIGLMVLGLATAGFGAFKASRSRDEDDYDDEIMEREDNDDAGEDDGPSEKDEEKPE